MKSTRRVELKQPNPTGHPLPSRFARTFYAARTFPNKAGTYRAQQPGEIVQDFYGSPYVVGLSGALRRRIL